MLNITNYKKLNGEWIERDGMRWKITSIQMHLMYYSIYIEQPKMGWDKIIKLSREYIDTKPPGPGWKLSCGSEYVNLSKEDIDKIVIFKQYLEYFI
jgi:hypothetical protein